MKKLFFTVMIFFPVYVFANTPDSLEVTPRYDLTEELSKPASNGGEVRLNSSPNIENLLKWHTRINETKKSFTGYRIQIHSVNSYGCNIEQLKEMRNKFEEAYPDIPAYLKYFDPDFKIRVGNFHSRLESISALYRVRKMYPSSYPVKTEISIEELKRIPMQDIPGKLQETSEEEGPEIWK